MLILVNAKINGNTVMDFINTHNTIILFFWFAFDGMDLAASALVFFGLNYQPYIRRGSDAQTIKFKMCLEYL